MKRNEIVISSPTEDWLQYHCVDRTKNDRKFLKIGVNKMPTYEGCHYETSELQMRNPAQKTLAISDPGSERGLKIIRDLDTGQPGWSAGVPAAKKPEPDQSPE
jgi:hypothetical protein